MWKEELKGALAFDLFSKTSKGTTVMLENLGRTFAFCLSQHRNRKNPDVSPFADAVFTQQPHVINFLEQYYSWIYKISSLQK